MRYCSNVKWYCVVLKYIENNFKEKRIPCDYREKIIIPKPMLFIFRISQKGEYYLNLNDKISSGS